MSTRSSSRVTRTKKKRSIEYGGNILAFDQSNERTGIAVLDPQLQLIKIGCIDFSDQKKLEPWEKREIVAQVTHEWCLKYKPCMVVIERVRLFSNYERAVKVGGRVVGKERKTGISLPTVESLAKLNGFIVHSARKLGIPVYSLDTKDWKEALFSRAPGRELSDKGLSVWYIEQVFGMLVDHDSAEAACIGLVAAQNENLLEEET